jgi:hypothetical protein
MGCLLQRLRAIPDGGSGKTFALKVSLVWPAASYLRDKEDLFPYPGPTLALGDFKKLSQTLQHRFTEKSSNSTNALLGTSSYLVCPLRQSSSLCQTNYSAKTTAKSPLSTSGKITVVQRRAGPWQIPDAPSSCYCVLAGSTVLPDLSIGSELQLNTRKVCFSCKQYPRNTGALVI